MSSVANISRVLVGVDLDEGSVSSRQIAGVLASARDPDIPLFVLSVVGWFERSSP